MIPRVAAHCSRDRRAVHRPLPIPCPDRCLPLERTATTRLDEIAIRDGTWRPFLPAAVDPARALRRRSLTQSIVENCAPKSPS